LARCWGMVRLRVSPLFLRLSFMIFRSTVHNVERYKAQKRTNWELLPPVWMIGVTWRMVGDAYPTTDYCKSSQIIKYW
jgi:hypothetical protein